MLRRGWLTVLGFALVVAATACGTRQSSADPSIEGRPIGDDPVKVGLGRVASCFKGDRW
jgi:hypothetical protein